MRERQTVDPRRERILSTKGKVLTTAKIVCSTATRQNDLSHPGGKGGIIADQKQVSNGRPLDTHGVDGTGCLHLPNARHPIVAGDRRGKTTGRVCSAKAGCTVVAAPNKVALVRGKGAGIGPISGSDVP